MERVVTTESAEATFALGEALGQRLGAGDVVLLSGPLGAGKTALAQGIARGLGVPSERRVQSPTYALCHVHPGRVPLYHLDLYRLADDDEIREAGLEDQLPALDGVSVVEWAERMGPSLLPSERVEVIIEVLATATTRRITMRAVGARAEALLGGGLFASG